MCCKGFAKRLLPFILAILLGLLSTNFLRTENLADNSREIPFDKIVKSINESEFSKDIKIQTLPSLCSIESFVIEFSGIEPVKIISQPKLNYTKAARQNRIQGKVNLQVTFQNNGKIGKIQVIDGLPDDLTEEAILAVKQIKFKPHSSHGMPRTVSREVECNFALD